MFTRESVKLIKLKRRLIFSYFIILILSVWIKNKFDDLKFQEDENSILMMDLLEKDKEIKKLKNELTNCDSAKILVHKPQIKKKIINKEKVENLEQKVDSSKSIQIEIESKDTLKINN
jgi:hypothetical protein